MEHDRDALIAMLIATDAEIARMQAVLNAATKHRMALAHRIELVDELAQLERAG